MSGAPISTGGNRFRSRRSAPISTGGNRFRSRRSSLQCTTRVRNNNSDNSGFSATDSAKLTLAPSAGIWAVANIALWALVFYSLGKLNENSVKTPGAPTRFVPDAALGVLGGLASACCMMGYRGFVAGPFKRLLTSAFPQGEGIVNKPKYNDLHYNLVDPRDMTPPGGPSVQSVPTSAEGPTNKTWTERIAEKLAREKDQETEVVI